MMEDNLPITVIVGSRSRKEDLCAAALARFCGAKVSQWNLADGLPVTELLATLQSRGPVAVIVSALTLSELSAAAGDKETVTKLTSCIPQLFVYGWAPDAHDVHLLQKLTDNRITQLLPITQRRHLTIDRRFLGLSRGVLDVNLCEDDGVPSHGFVLSGDENDGMIAGIDNCPVFVCLPVNDCRIYLSSESRIACLDTPIQAWPRLCLQLSSILPLVIWVRTVAGRTCWSPVRSLACLTIDDPPLVKEYGYFNYQRYLDEIKNTPIHLSCGVIPWNYRRSQSDVVKLISDNPDKLSIAYHGCDHIKGEFGHHDHGILSWQVVTAKQRMDIHYKKTGLRCDRVMIFPQHSYTTEAIRALSDAEMLGATTGNIFPVDPEEALTLKDLMDPAVTRYCGFPIFSRTFANQESEMLLYRLLGKPVIIIFHHDSFRDGYGDLGMLAERIERICAPVEWGGLEHLTTNCYQTRESLNGDDIDVRFLGCNFNFINPFERPMSFRLLKREPDPDRIAEVKLNSQNGSWDWNNEYLSVGTMLSPNTGADIQIRHKASNTVPVASRSLSYKVAVWMRRHLCEIRDRHFSFLRRV